MFVTHTMAGCWRFIQSAVKSSFLSAGQKTSGFARHTYVAAAGAGDPQRAGGGDQHLRPPRRRRAAGGRRRHPGSRWAPVPRQRAQVRCFHIMNPHRGLRQGAASWTLHPSQHQQAYHPCFSWLQSANCQCKQRCVDMQFLQELARNLQLRTSLCILASRTACQTIKSAS